MNREKDINSSKYKIISNLYEINEHESNIKIDNRINIKINTL